MIARPTFITNSSSSCLIVWEIDPANYPAEMTRYRGAAICPHCGNKIGMDPLDHQELDDYLDDRVRRIVAEKLAMGCAVFYNIEYLGHYREDEQEHGTDFSGHYSFQC